MKKILTLLGVTALFLPLLFACGKKEAEEDRREVDFTVVPWEELPEPLREAVEKNKKEEIRMSYLDGEDLYLVRGYGEQETGGYSISVLECWENEEKLCLDTRLLGPENPEEISKNPTWPCLVLRVETQDEEGVMQQARKGWSR